MLAPRASSAFVCFRCELQRSGPRLPVLPRRTTHANFSAAARRYDAFDDELTQAQTPRSRPRLSANPLGAPLRKQKGKALLRATTARLEGGVKTLGDEAQIIVLEEMERGLPEEGAGPKTVPPVPQKTVDIAESLQQEKVPVTSSELMQQIDNLRPIADAETDQPQYIRQKVYLKLSGQLLRGFTVKQLSKYYSVTKGIKHREKVVMKAADAGFKELQGATSKPAYQSEWHPGTTNLNLRLPGPSGSLPQTRLNKHLLVDQILRDLWKLVLLEEIEASGELELALKPWQLHCLTIGPGRTPLDRIGQERRAKIEIYWPDHILRITADKNTAEYAAKDIERLLQNTETKKVLLRPWAPYLDSKFTGRDLAEVINPSKRLAVGSLTSTQVESSRDAYTIRGLYKTNVQEAERALIRLLPLNVNSMTTIDTTRKDAAQGQTFLSPAPLETSRLELHVGTRHMTLGRWALPVPCLPKPTNASEQNTNATHSEQAPIVEDLTSVHAQISAMFATSARPLVRHPIGHRHHPWFEEPDDQFEAQFGQAFFPMDSSSTGRASVSAASFVPSLPGLHKLLIDKEFTEWSDTRSPVFEYTFVAAPEQPNFEIGQKFPSLRMQFAYRSVKQRDDEHFLKQLRLDLHERIHNVLLPDKAVDIRFIRRTGLDLKSPNTNKMMEDFRKTVIANIQSGEKLTAPDVVVNIPTWTIPGFPDARTTDTRGVFYMFTGIRFLQSVSATFMDNPVVVNTTQSGRFGSSSTSMSAYLAPNTALESQSGANSSSIDQRQDFVSHCFRIVDKITMAAASPMQPLRSVKRRDPTSARKIRREEPQSGLEGKDATGQDSGESSQPSSATMSQHLDIEDFEDPYLSSLRAEADPTDGQDEITHTPQDASLDVKEHNDAQPPKTPA